MPADRSGWRWIPAALEGFVGVVYFYYVAEDASILLYKVLLFIADFLSIPINTILIPLFCSTAAFAASKCYRLFFLLSTPTSDSFFPLGCKILLHH